MTKKTEPPHHPPPDGMAEVHEQLFRVPKHGKGRLKVGGRHPNAGRPRNELRRLVEEIGLHLAAPRLAHLLATSQDPQAVNGAAGIILRHALPTTTVVEGDIEHRFVAVVPAKAKSTKEWLALHEKGKA